MGVLKNVSYAISLIEFQICLTPMIYISGYLYTCWGGFIKNYPNFTELWAI